MLAVLAISCAAEARPPDRRGATPSEAVWAGGIDGGVWYLCKELASPDLRYDCRLYNDHTGDLMARGQFVLQRDSGDAAVVAAKGRPPTLEYSFYDGDIIELKGGLALVPDGVVDWPFGDGHGKRAIYRRGRRVGEDASY
jgi:hypothetical protein